MRKSGSVIFVIVILLFVMSVSSCSPAATDAGTLALTNCRMIDGTGAGPAENAVVLIQAGKVTAAGPAASVTVPAGAQTIDLQGATVLPGFVNAHVHRAYDEQQLQAWLAAGVTAVRDEAPMIGGDFLTERDRLNRDTANATIISATPILTVPGGYGTASFTSAGEASGKVKDYIGRGADIVKFSIEDDLQGRTWTLPTLDEVKAIVDAAHEGHRKASVHITHVRNLNWAVEAGVDDIAHMVVEPLSDETAAKIAQKGICWVPTLELWKGVSEMYALNWLDIAVENLSAFYKAGGKVALGTDFAGYTCSFDKGFPITEVQLMQRAGMTNMDIIVAGTKNAAYVCGRDDAIGTVEAGKDADLLIVNGDPLADLNALLDVRMVVHKGVVVVDNSVP
jgi:imidazolonepropionase-like amidohydrolase